MDLGLAGRIAIIAGASRGIGAAVARALAAEGAHVALLARTEAALQEVAAGIRGSGGQATAFAVDLSDAQARRDVVSAVAKEVGTPSLLVLSQAALYQPTRLHLVEEAEVQRFIDADLSSAVSLCQSVLPGMMEQRFGRIVALGSMAARTGVAGGTLYSALKAALEGLVRGVALEYSRREITANVVSVAFADTERLRARVAGDAEARARLERATATRRIPTPEEIAAVVTFLCSAQASSITGAVIDATAGAHLNNLW